jgi:DNA polymerase III psi subunit
LETDGSLNTHIGITHIVGDNQDDIWRASKKEPFRQEGSQQENNRSQRNISSTHEFHLPFGCQKLADEIYWAGM